MSLDLLALIDSWAKLAPDRPAHISSGRILTYAELTVQSNALATTLGEMLPADHSPVAVIGHKEPEMLVAFLGAVKSGHPYIPIDTSIPPQRIERIVESSGAGISLTSEHVSKLASRAKPGVLRPVSWNDPYYIIFTSGSTGEPKGVVITLECLMNFVEWMLAEQRPVERGEVFLNQAPFSFDLSVMDLYLSLATGGTLYSVTAEQIANLKPLYQAFGTSGITYWVSTPSFAQMCLVEKSFDANLLPFLKRFMFCGETLPHEVAARLLDRFPSAQVWNTYGPTEATCCTTSLNIDRSILCQYSPLPVGWPKPGTRILIMGEDGNELSSNERGEIVIVGPNVSPGYLGRPDLNENAFLTIDGMRAYRTGDSGHYEGGMLFFDGRLDQQIKLHGYRIELGDVESNLCAVEGIVDAAVIPVRKQDAVDSLAAFVILAKPTAASDFELALELKAKLAERLPAYMIPRKFYWLERFPMTSNGKVDRRRLEEMAA